MERLERILRGQDPDAAEDEGMAGEDGEEDTGEDADALSSDLL